MKTPGTGTWRSVVLVLLTTGTLFLLRPNPSPSNRLPPLLRSAALREFKLTETDHSRASSRYTLARDDLVVKVELISDLDADAAKQLIEDGVMGLEALYANALTPYPGDISNQESSDARFRPRLFRRRLTDGERTWFLLYATERHGYGATSADAVKFKSLLGWVFCQDKRTFYKIRMFGPLTTDAGEMESRFLSLTCR